jgi:outer membrane receptor for ferrienterochelin and colicins
MEDRSTGDGQPASQGGYALGSSGVTPDLMAFVGHSHITWKACAPMTRHRYLVEPRWRKAATAVAMASLMACNVLAATGTDEDELAMAYGDQPFVSIATGSKQPLSRAPAVASVITSNDIAAMGASDLDEVLGTVPGLHVAVTTLTSTPIYVMRGINLGYNPQVLMLVNGLPITTIYTGNRGNAWGGMPLENVARIEIIRGPGSALYGADAFAGVINVVTKTVGDGEGTQLGLRAGSFNSKDAWMLHAGTWRGIDVSAYLRWGHTDGHDRLITADAQSGWDQLTGVQASLAPGSISNRHDALDAALSLEWEHWRWRVNLKERSNVGSGTGVASALDPTGRSYNQLITTDLSYERWRIAPGWDASFQLSASHFKEFGNLVLFPAGALDSHGQPFADGMIGNPDKWERHVRVGASVLYTGLESHRIRLGFGVEREEIYRTAETKNFNPDYSRIGVGSISDLTDVSDTTPFMRPHDRRKRHVYVQDEWAFAKDWTFTAGLRHDDHSDFGGTTNPRLALVWDPAYNVTTKLMYGTAFRAPSMSELYAINNPVITGNPSLKPERIRTTEAAVSWQPMPQLQLGVNVFRYDMSDIIKLVNSVYQNTGKQQGQGLEFEARWDVVRELKLTGNYSFQRSVDSTTRADAGNAPHHQVYVRADWRFASGWSVHPQLNWVSTRHRVAGDDRPDLAGYGTVDLTLLSEPREKAWSVSLSVRNLFDADAREPSLYDRSPLQPFVSLPNDIPLAGRAVYVQASYRF